jgi:hypothetical protein
MQAMLKLIMYLLLQYTNAELDNDFEMSYGLLDVLLTIPS